MRQKTNNRNYNAFSLIETFLYISITSVLILLISIFISIILQSRIKNQTIAEVEQQGIQIMRIITQTIRNAEGINSPSQGTSASSLSLDVANAVKDPTIFDVSGNSLRITEGAGSVIRLTSSRVAVSNVVFKNLSKTGTPGTIRIEFTLTYINAESRNEYDYSKTFYGSASLRY